MPRNYSDGFSAYVTLKSDTYTLKYGYKCRLQRDGSLPTLGIVKILPADVTSALMQNFVLGCNSPKPPRASKKFADVAHGHESSFVSSDNMTAARADGWNLTQGKAWRKASSSDYSQTVYVTINGIKYAWISSRVPVALATGLDIGQVGVQVATAAEKNLIFGCSFPKPPRASRELTPDDRFETFRDPSVENIPAGWTAVTARGKGGAYTLDDFKTKV